MGPRFMTPYEIVEFANHEYGEHFYLVEDEKQLTLYSPKAQWKVFLNDRARFHKYTLYHYPNESPNHYHKQCEGYDIAYLIYYAVRHDLDLPCEYVNFLHKAEMVQLGRQLYESCMAFAFLSD